MSEVRPRQVRSGEDEVTDVVGGRRSDEGGDDGSREK